MSKPHVEHGKIVGGMDSTKGAYPWQVRYFTVSSPQSLWTLDTTNRLPLGPTDIKGYTQSRTERKSMNHGGTIVRDCLTGNTKRAKTMSAMTMDIWRCLIGSSIPSISLSLSAANQSAASADKKAEEPIGKQEREHNEPHRLVCCSH